VIWTDQILLWSGSRYVVALVLFFHSADSWVFSMHIYWSNSTPNYWHCYYVDSLQCSLNKDVNHFSSRIFTARRGWLAGWLDDTCRYCIKTAKPIWKLFRPSESPIILVSWDPCADTKFQREPLQRGVKFTGVWKKWRFSTEIAVYLGNGAR